MNEMSSNLEWDTLLLFAAYGVLIFLYLIILKLLMNCIEQMSQKNIRTQRSVIDVDIHRDAGSRHADDKMRTFDAFYFALTFLKLAVAIGGVVGIFVLITLKLNVFFAFGIAALTGVGVGQFIQWKNGRGQEIMKRYDSLFTRMGGYSTVMFIFFLIALIVVTILLILLP